MNEPERITLEVVRAEINGKLDLLLERTDILKSTVADHEARLRRVEEFGSPHAQVLNQQVEDLRQEQARTNKRLAYAGGGLMVMVTLVNIFGPDLGKLFS